MTARRQLVVAPLLAGLLAACRPPAPVEASTLAGEVTRGELGAMLDGYLRRAESLGFSGTVLVERGGEVVLHRGYGWADRSGRVPCGVDTVYDVGSVTKVLVASLVLTLAADGKLRLDDPITRFFPEVPADKRAITVHELLTHTSGLGNTYAAETAPDLDTARARILAQPLGRSPGSGWAYSNDGFALLRQLVARAGGEPFERQLRRRLLDRAGMKRTGFRDDASRWAPEALAHGYNVQSDHGVPTGGRDDGHKQSLLSTAADLYRLELARRRGLLPPNADELMTRPYAMVQDGVAQGYAWMLRDTAGGRAISHGGNDTPAGFAAELRRYPEAGVLLVILANSMWDDVPFLRGVRDGLEALLFGGRAQLPPAVLPMDDVDRRPFLGAYRLPTGGRLVITSEPSSLVLGAEGQDAVDALLAPEDGSGDERRQLGERSAALLAEARAGRGPQELRDVLAQLGPIGGVVPLGALASAAGTSAAYFRLQLERGQQTVRLVWTDDGELGLILTGTPRPVLPLVRVGADRLLAQSFFLQRGTLVRPRRGAGNAVVALELGGGALVATRVP
jgi:CubicO group peptidase (beta-lactamase class C family)